MALEKEIILNNGTKANYHIIKDLTHEQDTLNILVSSYVDESYREREKTATTFEDSNMSVSGGIYEMSNPKDFSYEEAYDYLKTIEPFIGSEDI